MANSDTVRTTRSWRSCPQPWDWGKYTGTSTEHLLDFANSRGRTWFWCKSKLQITFQETDHPGYISARLHEPPILKNSHLLDFEKWPGQQFISYSYHIIWIGYGAPTIRSSVDTDDVAAAITRHI